VIITAGYFGFETFDDPDWEKQVRMYTTSAIGPVFVVQRLVKAGLLDKGSKVILVSSESGSITLRHEKEGGGNYGHHASKAALNMVGKLLSLDLKEKGIAVGLVHPGFMRTEMTKSVGFDKYWDAGGGKMSLCRLCYIVADSAYSQPLPLMKLRDLWPRS
jgi:NAD(P)-dependent dehydrogenase (short-subunit alcohol dehydrogenase family)